MYRQLSLLRHGGSFNTGPCEAKMYQKYYAKLICCSVTQLNVTLCDCMTTARQASLSFTISWTLLKLMSIESVMPANHLILCRPLLLLPSIRVPFLMSWFFTSGGLSIGASASTSVLPMNSQDWFPLGWTVLSSLQSKGLQGESWRVFSSNTTVQKHQFFSAQPSLWSNSHIHTWLLRNRSQTFITCIKFPCPHIGHLKMKTDNSLYVNWLCAGLSHSVMSNSLWPCGAFQSTLSVGILQARILEWVAKPSSRGTSQPRHQTQVSCICWWILSHLSYQGSPWILEWVAYPFPGDLPDPGIELGYPTLQKDCLPAELLGKPINWLYSSNIKHKKHMEHIEIQTEVTLTCEKS